MKYWLDKKWETIEMKNKIMGMKMNEWIDKWIHGSINGMSNNWMD